MIIAILLKAALLFRQEKGLFIQGEVPLDQPEGLIEESYTSYSLVCTSVSVSAKRREKGPE